MKLKVCGMRDTQNILALDEVKPDLMGMIFYAKSKRHVDQSPDFQEVAIPRVGVFVNANLSEVIEKANVYQLAYIQLHGDETVEYVKELFEQGYRIIKVFRIKNQLPIETMKSYEPFVEYFLFDTQTSQYGGSGEQFDWSLLEQYHLKTPFFLSGGISLEDLESIKSIQNKQLAGIDVNSRFEISPGVKDIAKVKALKERL